MHFVFAILFHVCHVNDKVLYIHVSVYDVYSLWFLVCPEHLSVVYYDLVGMLTTLVGFMLKSQDHQSYLGYESTQYL